MEGTGRLRRRHGPYLHLFVRPPVGSVARGTLAARLGPRLPGVPDNAEWLQGYEKMLEAARNHGWIDETGNAICADLEWVD